MYLDFREVIYRSKDETLIAIRKTPQFAGSDLNPLPFGSVRHRAWNALDRMPLFGAKFPPSKHANHLSTRVKNMHLKSAINIRLTSFSYISDLFHINLK